MDNQQRSSLAYIEDTVERTKHNHVKALYYCACGNKTVKTKTRVVNGYTTTCGDRKQHRSGILNPTYKHGLRDTREYGIWIGIKQRMFNENNKDYARYGARLQMSRTLADSFEAFLEEVGYAPTPKHQVDRIDNTKGYIEGNLRWATSTEQLQNTEKSLVVTINGREYESMYDAARGEDRAVTTIYRWCDGFTDYRNGKYYPPREGCYRERKYA